MARRLATDIMEPVLVRAPDALTGESLARTRAAGAPAVLLVGADGLALGVLPAEALAAAAEGERLARAVEDPLQVAVVSGNTDLEWLYLARRTDPTLEWFAVRSGDEWTGIISPERLDHAIVDAIGGLTRSAGLETKGWFSIDRLPGPVTIPPICYYCDDRSHRLTSTEARKHRRGNRVYCPLDGKPMTPGKC